MNLTRRALIEGVAAAATVAAIPEFAGQAQDATPPALDDSRSDPGVAIAQIRKLPSMELADAVFPDVMAHFVPGLEGLTGFLGYVLAFDDQDPAAHITLTLLADESAAVEADAVARQYVSRIDARFVVETPAAITGPIRIFEVTSRTQSELPPLLHGCFLTMRQRENAPDADIPAVIETARSGLVPILAQMPGFILYCWIETEGGRTAINIWETLEQLDAGNEAVADFVAENTAASTMGEPVVNQGMIGYGALSSEG